MSYWIIPSNFTSDLRGKPIGPFAELPKLTKEHLSTQDNLTIASCDDNCLWIVSKNYGGSDTDFWEEMLILTEQDLSGFENENHQ